MYWLLIAIGICILLIGFFAGIEIAFISANKMNVELKKKQGKSSGIIMSRFMEDPARFIGTTLIGINLVMVVYGLLISEALRPFWGMIGIQNQFVRFFVETALSALIIIFLGEFIPKAVWRAKADNWLYATSGLIHFFYRLLFPIAAFFITISKGILKYGFDVRISEKKEAFTWVDLEFFFQQTKEQDEDSQELNKELFENALSLPGVRIRQCLIPRKEIEAVNINTPISEAREKFISTKLSKMVVYENNIDNILGYIHQLDLFKSPADIKSILHPIPAVPESMSATDLIGKFTKERKSIAWVVDEFGGTAGIITMEDVLEEIFGEIKDEYDTEEFVEKQIASDEYILSGRLELDYLNEKYDFNFPVSESETLSGYIINYHESIPRQKDKIIIDNYEFDVLNVSETRIEMVKVKVLKQ
jgi:CBS domain containing-hemolysin-like protein